MKKEKMIFPLLIFSQNPRRGGGMIEMHNIYPWKGLHCAGIKDVAKFDFMDPPDSDSINTALRQVKPLSINNDLFLMLFSVYSYSLQIIILHLKTCTHS